MEQASIVTLTDETFEQEVLQSKQPVLVDFWAPWCGPCKTLAPLVDRIAQRYQNRLKVGKINIDDHTNSPSLYQVSSIPTLILFHEGQAVARKIGVVSEEDLEKMIAPYVSSLH